MKLNKTVIATGLMLALTPLAQAKEIQVDAVTMTPYVRLVGGVNYTNNSFEAGEAGSRMDVASNQWGTSYIGMGFQVAITDLLQGVANLESGFGTEEGQTNDPDSLFNRQANVGLKHTHFGEMTVGTHLALSQDIIDMDPMNFQSMGLNTLTNGVNDGSASHSIRYRSPEWNGFQLSYMHQFGGKVADSERSQGDAVSLVYQNGGAKIRAIYNERADHFGRHTGAEFYGLGTIDQWLYVKSLAFAGSYDFGDTKVFAGYQQVEAPDAGHGLSYTFDDEAQIAWLGVNYQVTEKLTALAAIYQSEMDYSDKQSSLYTAGLTYEMNDYFTFYTTLGYVNNNTIAAELIDDVGANNHALNYLEYACEDTSNCDGADQMGGYTGVVFTF